MLDVIRKRRSIRGFLKKGVEDRKLDEVLKAAMFAPTSWGTRAWEFVVVKDPVTKKKLSEATTHSRFVKDAPVVVVICYNISSAIILMKAGVFARTRPLPRSISTWRP